MLPEIEGRLTADYSSDTDSGEHEQNAEDVKNLPAMAQVFDLFTHRHHEGRLGALNVSWLLEQTVLTGVDNGSRHCLDANECRSACVI